MKAKIAAAMLLATALPFSSVYAHSVSVKYAPVKGYMYFMLSVGAVYIFLLLFRAYRQKQQNQVNSHNTKN